LRIASFVAGLIALAGDSQHVSNWSPAVISGPMWESHPALDPLNGDLWFVRSTPDFAGWKLFVSECVSGRLTAPVPQRIAGNGLEADPWFSPDGKMMWFISTGSNQLQSSGLDIWRRIRLGHGRWSRPERLPAPVNSDFAEWFPRRGADGWLYFGSRRPGGFGKDDIWRARHNRSGGWAVENAGPGLNTADAEYEFEPAASGTWGILSTDQGLVRVVRRGSRWVREGKYGPEVNTNATEIGPLILPDRTFVFSRDSGPKASGELFIASRSRVRRADPRNRCKTSRDR